MRKSSRAFNYKFWIDFILPNRCPICGEVIVWNELICNKCESQLSFMDEPFSPSEKIFSSNMDNICAVFDYKDNAAEGIYNLKTRKGLNFAEYSSEYLYKYISENEISEKGTYEQTKTAFTAEADSLETQTEYRASDPREREEDLSVQE